MAQDEGRHDDDRSAKISNGPNARPKDETIAQTGPGLPNDSSSPVAVDEEEAKRIEERIRSI